MKNRSFLLLLLAAFMGQLHAQKFDPAVYQIGKKYPGYIIRLNGDTSFGFVEANYRCLVSGLGSSNQTKCVFYLNETDKKPEGKYSPTEIKAYQIADMFYKSLLYSGGGPFKSENFCLLVKAGHMSQYVWYSTKEGYSTMKKGSGESQEDFDERRFISKNIFHRDGINPFDVDALAFGGYAKKLSQALSDYPELAEKVANKEKGYRFDKLYETINEYNEYFAKKENE